MSDLGEVKVHWNYITTESNNHKRYSTKNWRLLLVARAFRKLVNGVTPTIIQSECLKVSNPAFVFFPQSDWTNRLRYVVWILKLLCWRAELNNPGLKSCTGILLYTFSKIRQESYWFYVWTQISPLCYVFNIVLNTKAAGKVKKLTSWRFRVLIRLTAI